MAAVSAAMGRPFMPHQRMIVDVFLEVQSEEAGDPEPGAWAYDDGTVTIQRRGGKTSLIAPIAAHRARLIKRARMFMTAQNRDKARARWMDVTEDMLASVLRPDVSRKVSHTFEELRWRESGSLLLPFAPNEEGLHSETPDLVFVDELWAFTAEQGRAVRAGYVPAFATTNGQALKMSTAGTEKSAWLNTSRAEGRRAVQEGRNLGTAYWEFGVPDTLNGVSVLDLDGDDLVELCIEYHPAICHEPGCPGARARKPCPHGFTVRPNALRSAWVDMERDPMEFLRAYGNRDAEDRAEEWRFLDRDTYLRRVDATGIPKDARVQLGVWVDEDSKDAAVSAGWRSPDGVMRTELLEVRPGTTWVGPYVTEVASRHRVRAVACANVGAARAVAGQIPGDKLLAVSQADVSAACVRHRDELEAGVWVHRHHDELMAAAAAVVRGTGAAWRWAKDGASVSALGSQTLAGWAADNTPAEAGFWIG